MKKIYCLLFACMLFIPSVKSTDIATFILNSNTESNDFDDVRYVSHFSRAAFLYPLLEGNYYTITIMQSEDGEYTDTLYCRRAYYSCTIADSNPGDAIYDTGTLTADGIIGFYNIACDLQYDTDESGQECPPGWTGDWTEEDYQYAEIVKGFYFKFSGLPLYGIQIVISDDN